MGDYKKKISNDELQSLPLRGFGGRVVVVDSLEGMCTAYESLRGEVVLGFDTETRPSFSKNVQHTVSLLQLSTGDTAYLFRLKHCSLSDDMLSLLSDSGVLKIGAAIRDDLRALRGLRDFAPSGFVDLQGIIGRWGVEELSVRKMAAVVLGIRISKAQRLSNWDSLVLTPAQCDYAAMDAWVCRSIYCALPR